MTDAWRFRDGTLDKAIFNAVVRLNEYRLPDSFAPGDIVIDVGAHIGAFAEAAKVLDDAAYREVAVHAVHFVREKLEYAAAAEAENERRRQRKRGQRKRSRKR